MHKEEKESWGIRVAADLVHSKRKWELQEKLNLYTRVCSFSSRSDAVCSPVPNIHINY